MKKDKAVMIAALVTSAALLLWDRVDTPRRKAALEAERAKREQDCQRWLKGMKALQSDLDARLANAKFWTVALEIDE